MAAADSTIIEFKKHVQQYTSSHRCFGYTSIDGVGHDARVEFVPRAALTTFWTVERIRDILWSVHPTRIQADTQHILNKYLVVFSVLVWMSMPSGISTIMDLNIDDGNLPVDDKLINGTDQPDVKEFLLEFSKHQWKFCPLTLDCRPFKKVLNAYHILPITKKDLLDPTADEEDGDVLVYKAQWHRSCLGSLPSPYVVLKEYRVTGPTSEAYKMLSNEVDIYSNLGDEDFDYIVKYYGSIVQQDKFTLILEYAGEGNLLNYFETRPHPHTALDRTRFWQAFFFLLLALEKVHHLCKAKDQVLKGVHQDIRPQNILVFPSSAETPDEVRFKLADFGTGHVRKCRERGLDALAAQRAGNGMYSSPESYRDDKITKAQSPRCDIWSLGAVASEALVWSIRGEPERLKYQENRCQKTRETKLKGGFHEGSFHDGNCRLPIVEEQHRAVLEFVDHDDTISSSVSDIILNSMLIANPLDGFDAAIIFQEWEEILDGVQSISGSPRLAQGNPYSPMQRAPTKRSNTRASVKTKGSWKRDSTNSASSHHTGWLRQESMLSEEPSDISSPVAPGADPVAPRRSLRHRYSGSWAGPARKRNESPGLSARRAGATGSIGHQRVEPLGPVEADPSSSDEGPEIDGQDSHISDLSTKRPHPPTYSNQTAIHTTHPERHISSRSSPCQPVHDHFQVRDERYTSWARKEPGLNIRTYLPTAPARNSAPVISEIPAPAIDPRVVPGFSQKSPIITTRSSREAPIITIDDVYTKYIKPKDKSWSKGNLWRPSKVPGLFALFPSLQDTLRELKGYGDGRDQYFIIDDSQSMARHRDQMGKTVRVLAHLLKKGKVDPDKMELFYTCKRERHIGINSSDFQKHIDEHVFSDGPCHIFQGFGEIATEILKTSGNGVSIYILTNGRWDANPGEPDNLCRVDHVIKRFLKVIEKDHKKQSNHVGVQFIRFYEARSSEDVHGETRLRYLDDNLSHQFKEMGLEVPKGDIVDTTDWDGPVHKMLLGGVLSEVD